MRRPASLQRFALAAAAVALFVAAHASSAFAGYAVQPADGSLTDGNPTFLVYVGDGEMYPRVEVSTSPDHSDYGFSGSYVGSCDPTTPFGDDQHKVTCQLPSFEVPLAPGTYYWAYTYEIEANVCTTFLEIQTCYPEIQSQFSGPFKFTVGQPVAPAGAGLVSPDDGAVVGTDPRLVIHAPAGASIAFYASDSSIRLSDGTPAGLTAFSCAGETSGDSNYTCVPDSDYDLDPGQTYYWWALITGGDGTTWIYGPRSFTVRDTSSGGASGGLGHSSGSTTHSLLDAPMLRRASRFTGKSIKETRLSNALYGLSKLLGAPRLVSVACWGAADWDGLDPGAADPQYHTLAFVSELMPRWVNLSPPICREVERLIHGRPAKPTLRMAEGVEALTHEMMHALGITKLRYSGQAEPMAECYGMQLSMFLALKLGVPEAYANQLAKLNLVNYKTRPPSYRDYSRCRENGAWDLFKNKLSPPWHDFQG